ncbi:hypothetical protein M407DRAFT_29709 [Tulasnella calospora MUT 4182]|uniref:Uncharacterized protein n=1 Tax=Tulasnella calospora MUT 4182 TaxID=1051891 RepID=A0A0C3Q8J7_9AGAM|nr:hypothetical protein M407DRAFT_29709 [Tulasnella calospora MUT 4182]
MREGGPKEENHLGRSPDGSEFVVKVSGIWFGTLEELIFKASNRKNAGPYYIGFQNEDLQSGDEAPDWDAEHPFRCSVNQLPKMWTSLVAKVARKDEWVQALDRLLPSPGQVISSGKSQYGTFRSRSEWLTLSASIGPEAAIAIKQKMLERMKQFTWFPECATGRAWTTTQKARSLAQTSGPWILLNLNLKKFTDDQLRSKLQVARQG